VFRVSRRDRSRVEGAYVFNGDAWFLWVFVGNAKSPEMDLPTFKRGLFVVLEFTERDGGSLNSLAIAILESTTPPPSVGKETVRVGVRRRYRKQFSPTSGIVHNRATRLHLFRSSASTLMAKTTRLLSIKRSLSSFSGTSMSGMLKPLPMRSNSSPRTPGRTVSAA